MTTVTKRKSEATKYTLFKASIEDIFDSHEKLNDIAIKWTQNAIITLAFEKPYRIFCHIALVVGVKSKLEYEKW